MTVIKKHRCQYKGRLSSDRLIFVGAALLMILVACSQNGGPMGGKSEEDGAKLHQNSPATAKDWRRVIVSLKVPDLDKMQAKSATLKDPAAAKAMDQKIAIQIAAVADRVLTRVKPEGAQLIRRYNTLPLLALRVTPRAEALLKSLPEVLSVEADALNRPTP